MSIGERRDYWEIKIANDLLAHLDGKRVAYDKSDICVTSSDWKFLA